MPDAIVTHMRRFITLSDDEARHLLSRLVIIDVKKKEHLLKAGEICRDNYFIVKGCFRLYLITEKGAEQIIQFGIENWWITDYMSLKSGRPSGFYIQATENSQVIALGRETEDELFDRIPQLERYFRLVLERAYSAQLNRIHYIFNLTGEEMYRRMSKAYPEFVQRVPQYMLASFFGITPEFLSMLRARKE